MIRGAIDFQRLGGPGAVTWWAFGVSLVDRLITVSVQPANTAAPLSVRIVSTVLAQLVMFAPLVVLRFTLLKDPTRPRPWVALAGFAVASVLRGLSVDWFLHYFGGLPLLPELRVYSGFLPTVIPLIVVAYVVNTLRERRRELATLLEVREQLNRARVDAENAVQRQNDELVSRVRSVLETEISAVSGSKPADAVAQLQRTATDVVRPLSHELATSFAAREETPVAEVSVKVGWRDVVGDAAVDRPLMPAVTTLLLSGIWLSAAAVFAPVRWVFLVSLVLIPILLAVANVSLSSILPRLVPAGRVAVVLSACSVVGMLTGILFLFGTRSWSSGAAVTIAAMFYVVLVSACMAVVNGVLAARTTVLEQTADSIAELRLQVIRTRQLQWFHQRALARALHGPVQSAVTASALRLVTASEKEPLTADLVDSVRADLIRVMDVLGGPESEVASLASGLARVVGIWDGVCRVSVTTERQVDAALAEDAVVRAAVIDIVTEAVSNAVRHGAATDIAVNITSGSDGVHITVTDNGSSTATPGPQGLGGALLSECAQEWSLTETGAGHELNVLLPAAVRGIPAHA